ncbi:MAG: GNAT family protein [Thermoleophilia bacterium]|nr:GNAT family protein [Thermoleophilia bacterium]
MNADSPQPTLHGRLVALRPVRAEDLPVLHDILEEPEVAEWWRRTEWERVDELGAVTFAIEFEGRVVGCIQYTEQTDPDYRSAAIDIFVSAAVHGRGVGSDAMRTLIAWLIDARGHHRLMVDPATANARAIHVYRRLGFRPVGVLRRYERVEGDHYRDALLLDLLAEEFVRE